MPPLIRRQAIASRPPQTLPGLNRRLTLELDRGRVRELLIVVGLAGVMLLPLLAYVWQNVEWIESGYAIERLKNRRERLMEANHQLRLERSTLTSLGRVQRLADERLGLAEPPGGTVVLIASPDPAVAPEAGDDRVASISSIHGGTKPSGTQHDDAADHPTR